LAALFVVQHAASLWLICTLVLMWRIRREVEGTTLLAAWRWAWSGWCLWAVGWCCEFIPAVPNGVRDQIWYAVALLLLAALISILGAKRPGSRAWNFVTFSMLLTLSWPALFSWLHGWPPAPMRLMEPALWAYAVVCVMGLGNYVGTRFLWSALWLGLALSWLVMPYSGWAPEILPTPTGCRMRATLCAGLSVIWPCLLAASSRAFLAPWDRVWVDFVNMFGIVWGRRIQDRFNETARQSKWGVKLDFYGLAWDDAQTLDAGGQPVAQSGPPVRPRAAPTWTPEMAAALQWLLRRFVDQVWLERRLSPRGRA
jgi:hypothetical protein